MTDLPPLSHRVEDAVGRAISSEFPQLQPQDALVRRSDHADFQANAALPMAKRAGRSPRDIATALVKALDDPAAIATAEVSGPGFVNLTLTDGAIWDRLDALLASDDLGIGAPDAGSVTVIDYSAPNVAKQMHVGHLRTTIIGDALARMLEARGARVIRQNHLGDWGTQFGMIIQFLDEHPENAWHERHRHTTASRTVEVLDETYRLARASFEADAAFADRARERVVALQSGDPATRKVWRDLIDVSTQAFNEIYSRLGVDLSDSDIAGESAYNDSLAEVVTELANAGIAVESQGAICVFDDRFRGPNDSPIPLIVRKKDGGYGYAATDLATIRHRTRRLGATRVLYVVDARQRLHFQMVFAAARRAGWLPDDVEVVHVEFGTIMDATGKPFKTRSGGTVPLSRLLDDAVDAASRVVTEKDPDLSPDRAATIAVDAGIGAVKYAELSTARGTDYKFDAPRMVALTGNTGVYLQYAHTRICSVLRKAGDTGQTGIDNRIRLEPAERALLLHLDAYPDALAESSTLYEPHRLCGYLYELAKLFSVFYEACPILGSDDTVAGNRLALVTLARRTLAHGLGLLGIAAPQRM